MILEEGVVYWGPKPFRNLDAWFSHQGLIKGRGRVAENGSYAANREIKGLTKSFEIL